MRLALLTRAVISVGQWLVGFAAVAVALGGFAQTEAAVRAEPMIVHQVWRQGAGQPIEGWALERAAIVEDRGSIQLVPDESAAPDSLTGRAEGPVLARSPAYREAIVSWNAVTPPGSWIEARLRVRVDQRWSDWYVMGVWSSDDTEDHRHSVRNQNDNDGRVLTDTLLIAQDADAFQVRIDLFASSVQELPSVSLVTVATTGQGAAGGVLTGEQNVRGLTLPVPERSQMVYPNGGEIWCSPTSTSMVMAYWADSLMAPELDISVPDVAAGTYDPVYRGNGNWPFNTAFAARDGLIAYVSRLHSMAEVESWVAAGVPVIASLGWVAGELPEAPIGSTNGHLLVIVGFTPAGDVVVNDPAGDPRLGQRVRRVYARQRFESLWQAHSSGTVYLIYPRDWRVPG